MKIYDNICIIEERIQRACQRAGRDRSEITLMGVTKFQPPQSIEEAYKAGIRFFGESRVQEAIAKFGENRLNLKDIELHLIGSLQRNKAKTALGLFDCIQSLDRESLITELAKHAKELNEPFKVLLEYRTGEDSKSGFDSLDSLLKAADLAFTYPQLKICGFMTMAPYTADEKTLRRAFKQLVKVRDGYNRHFPDEKNCNIMSMGMSGDFETAIEEGSTLLRIGGAIFGEG